MAFTYQSKIQKEKGAKASILEDKVAKYLFELENNSNEEIKAELAKLHIVSAKSVDLGKGKSAIALFVPYRELRGYQRVHASVVQALEKKLGRHVLVLAQRRILPKSTKNNTKKVQQRPRSRTLTAVHDAILDDLVFPAQIVDKRIRQRVDGSRSYRMYVIPFPPVSYSTPFSSTFRFSSLSFLTPLFLSLSLSLG
jgi:small subunit ribosomal protein S7e